MKMIKPRLAILDLVVVLCLFCFVGIIFGCFEKREMKKKKKARVNELSRTKLKINE